MLTVSQFKTLLWGRGNERWPPFFVTGSALSLSPGSPLNNTEPHNLLGHLLVYGHSDFLLTLPCLWEYMYNHWKCTLTWTPSGNPLLLKGRLSFWRTCQSDACSPGSPSQGSGGYTDEAETSGCLVKCVTEHTQLKSWQLLLSPPFCWPSLTLKVTVLVNFLSLWSHTTTKQANYGKEGLFGLCFQMDQRPGWHSRGTVAGAGSWGPVSWTTSRKQRGGTRNGMNL